MTDGAAQEVTCTGCGAREAPQPPTWSAQVSARGTTVLCEDCTRTHVRSIEARLDEQWW